MNKIFKSLLNCNLKNVHSNRYQLAWRASISWYSLSWTRLRAVCRLFPGCDYGQCMVSELSRLECPPDAKSEHRLIKFQLIYVTFQTKSEQSLKRLQHQALFHFNYVKCGFYTLIPFFSPSFALQLRYCILFSFSLCLRRTASWLKLWHSVIFQSFLLSSFNFHSTKGSLVETLHQPFISSHRYIYSSTMRNISWTTV